MKKQLILFILIVVSVSLLSGCGDKKEKDRKIQVKDGTILRNVPEWYAYVPADDDTIYSTGTALSPDMIEAKQKAKSLAIDGIVDRYGISQAQIESLPRNVMDEKFDLVKQAGKIRAYVLLKIPVDEFE